MERSVDPASPSRGRVERSFLFYVIGLASGFALGVGVARMLRDPDIELVRLVRDLAADEFVGEVEPTDMIDDALRGMLRGLDRHSHYYGTDEIARLDRETTGEFRGIGVVFRPPTRAAQVLFAFPDSPAAQAGVQVGDRFLEIDGLQVADLETGGLQRLLQRQTAEEIVLVVEHLNGAQETLRIIPDRVVDPTVRHARLVEGNEEIGYVAITSFSHRTPEEFDSAVEELRRKGARALVLDLRANPGGILDAALRIANRFIGEGVLVITEERHNSRVSEARPDAVRYSELDLVVLVDEGSASASEVLAGALQDHAAAALVGVPTYGKGTVQTLTRIGEDRAIVKITTANYLTPSGRRIERADDGTRTGIDPDLIVELSEEQQRAVHTFLTSYSPPSEVQADLAAWERELGEAVTPKPPSDSQLLAALDLLTGYRPFAYAAREE